MFKKDYERTPQEKARRAQLSILARILGCGYLVYIMVQLLQTPKDERPTAMLVIAIVLLVAAAAVIGITIFDLVNALKTGRFNPAFYEDAANDAAEQPKPAELADGSDVSDDDQPGEGDGDDSDDSDDEDASDEPGEDDEDGGRN